MKKEFRNPTMSVKLFNRENIVTTSANYEAAKQSLEDNDVSVGNTKKVKFAEIVF